MKNFAWALTILIILVAFPVRADEGYKFKVSVASVFDALGKLGGGFQKNRWEEANEKRRAQMKTDKVLLFERRERARWRVLFTSCSRDNPDCEIRIYDRGGAAFRRDEDPLVNGSARKYDLGFIQNGDGTLSVRCLRAACWIRYKTDQTDSELSLLFAESANIGVAPEVDVVFPALSGELIPRRP